MAAAVESQRDCSRLSRETVASSMTEVRIVEAAPKLLARKGVKATTTRVCAYYKRSVVKDTIRKVEPWIATLGLLGIVNAGRVLRFLLTGYEFPFADPEEVGRSTRNCLVEWTAPSHAGPCRQYANLITRQEARRFDSSLVTWLIQMSKNATAFD